MFTGKILRPTLNAWFQNLFNGKSNDCSITTCQNRFKNNIKTLNKALINRSIHRINDKMVKLKEVTHDPHLPKKTD